MTSPASTRPYSRHPHLIPCYRQAMTPPPQTVSNAPNGQMAEKHFRRPYHGQYPAALPRIITKSRFYDRKKFALNRLSIINYLSTCPNHSPSPRRQCLVHIASRNPEVISDKKYPPLRQKLPRKTSITPLCPQNFQVSHAKLRYKSYRRGNLPIRPKSCTP